MKKILSTLFLTSFLAVLVVPAVALAQGACSYQSCNGTVGSVPCLCGGHEIANSSTLYCCGTCNNGAGALFTTQDTCQSAMSGGTADQGGYQQIPTNVPSTPGELVDLVEKIGNWIFSILLGVAVIFLVVAGFYFITAGGSAEKVTTARQMLINALIGVAVALAAKGMVAIIRGFILK